MINGGGGGNWPQDQHQMSGCIEDAEMEKETTEGGPQGETKWAEYDAEKAKRSVFSSADWGWEARYMETNKREDAIQ